jgi:hypothetical protein
MHSNEVNKTAKIAWQRIKEIISIFNKHFRRDLVVQLVLDVHVAFLKE